VGWSATSVSRTAISTTALQLRTAVLLVANIEVIQADDYDLSREAAGS
jgi:hypothetical protein